MKHLYYLTQAVEEVTARELAEYTGVSERTVKSDLAEVRLLAEEAGCTLLSKKGKGYCVRIEDKELFKVMEEKLHFQYSPFNYTQETKDRTNRIVRILLVQEDFIKLDKIAEQLYLSRSAIKNNMQHVRSILEAFHLCITSKPGYGIKVDGNEINIRFCMLELFIDHDYRNVTNIQDKEYLAYFSLEKVDIGSLRHHFLKVLRESETRVVDNNTHKLVRYFFLIYNRFAKGYHLQFDEEDQIFLRQMGEYRTAKKILDVLEALDTHISVDEAEVFGLELLLLMWNDLNESDELSARYPYFYLKSNELAEKIIIKIRGKWGIDFDKMSGIRSLLISAIIPIYTRVHFAFLGYNRTIGRRVENNMMSSSPVCIALALNTAWVIKQECGLQLSQSDILNYTVRFYIAIARIHYDYVPRRILISAQTGSQSCAIIRDKLIKKFGVEAFAKLDTINAYEVRRLKQEDYDYMILNFAPYYYRYDLPVIYVDSIPDERQMNQIYHQVILGGYRLRELQTELGFEEDFIFQNFPYEGRTSFIHLLCYKYCGSKDISAMEKYLMQYTDICVWNGIASIVLDSSLTGSNQFRLFCLETPGIWEKKPIKYILFISVSFHGENKTLKFLEQLSHELIHHPESLERLAETKSMNQFYEIVKRELTLGQ